MAVHQLIPSFVSGDATGQAALHLRLLLRRLGHHGDIYAAEVEPKLASLARPARALAPRQTDLVLYHHGLASPLSGRLLHLPCRKGLVFHNISPAQTYRGTPLYDALVSGRAQLAAMAPFTDLAIGVSRYNAAELTEAGHRNVHVVPLFVEPERFTRASADPVLLERLSGGEPTVVSVSRVAAHKRFEDLLALHEELLRVRPRARLLCVGGYEPGSRYFRGLQARARKLPGVTFLGRVSHAELVAAYRAAHVFVSMSEHEGFGVPLVEAMAAQLPVVAFGAAAVPETMGGAGVVFDEKRFAGLAELCAELAMDGELRASVLAGQARRLRDFTADAVLPSLETALRGQLPAAPGAPARTGSVRAGRRSKPRPHVAVVVQRFGEALGGTEWHARMVAERLAKHREVTVLTTTALDHLTWENHFPAGETVEEGLRVRRFEVSRSREMRSFNRLSRGLFGRPDDRMHEEHWLAEQGPLVPGLFRHLAEESGRYDAFVFFTYLYAPTAWGLPLVADRALVVPTAHDEPPLSFGVFRDVFERPRALLCNTPEELALIQRHFPAAARARIVGVGIEPRTGRAERFRAKHGLSEYLLYVGRLEEGKGVGELLRQHRALRRRRPDVPPLVLAGASGMRITPSDEVRLLGRISEDDKLDALAGALAVVVPSRFESLSLLTLEALAQGTPVLVNGASDVLLGQVERSGAGAAYTDVEGLERGLDAVRAQRPGWSRKARAYAARHTWAKVMDLYAEELGRIEKERRR